MKRWVKIAIVAAIVLIVAAIFCIKAFEGKEDTMPSGDSEQMQSETADMPAATPAQGEAADKYPLKITVADLEAIKAYGVPTVIDFGSDSCIPCKEMAPVLKTLNAEWQGVAAVQFMDVWKYTDGVEDFPVSVIPTQVFFNADGTPFVPSDELAGEIAFTMYSTKDTNEHVFTVHQGGVTEEQMRMIFAEMGIE